MKPISTQTYLKSRVMTASPEELQLMLYDGAIRYAQLFRQAILDNQIESAQAAYERADAILTELHQGLRPERAPDLVDRYTALYDFCQRRLGEAEFRRVPQPVEDALRVLQHIRQTWVLVMEKIREEGSVRSSAPMVETEEYAPLAVNA
jgi:flagellar protein FliS